MKKYFLLLCLLAKSFLSTSAIASPDPAASQTLSLTPASVSLPNLHQFTESEVPFTLKNLSHTQTITLLSLEKSCSCTSAIIEESDLPPQASTRLVATIKALDRFGPFDSTIKVSWKIEGSEKVHTSLVTIHANAVALLQPEPPAFHFPKLHSHQPALSSSISITRGNAAEKWDRLEVSSPSPSIQTQLVKKDSDHFSLLLTIDPSTIPIGQFKSDLTLTCFDGDHPLEPSKTIPVTAQILGSIESKPPSLYLGVLSSPEKRTLSAQLRSKTGTPLELLSIESSHPDFATATATSQSGAEIKLLCTFDPSSAKANQSGRFLLRTRINGKEETLAIPFIAFVKSP